MHPIKRYRQAKGWTQEGLAAELHVNVNSVTAWESGATPRPRTLVNLAEKLGVDPLRLLNEIEEWKSESKEETA